MITKQTKMLCYQMYSHLQKVYMGNDSIIKDLMTNHKAADYEMMDMSNDEDKDKPLDVDLLILENPNALKYGGFVVTACVHLFLYLVYAELLWLS